MLRKITDTATSAHTESLQFLSSAGAWDRTSKQFVFPGIARGQPVLTIVDVERGKKEREIAARGGRRSAQSRPGRPTASRSRSRAWSAGSTTCSSTISRPSKLRRLTTDPFAELDPAWSPDGQTLAFSTDRFTTNLQTLVVGRSAAGGPRRRVAETVQPAGGFEDAKNISPQWTADGSALYFLSDRGGVSNIYRTEFGGATTQLTNLLTGASGITELSPALSVAQGPGRLQRLRGQRLHDLRARDGGAARRGRGAVTLPINAAVLPPRQAGAGPVYAALRTRRSDCRPRARRQSRQRNTSRSSVSTSPGSRRSAVGVDPFGTYAAGGMSFVFSDMLGNHSLYDRRAGDQPLRRNRRQRSSTSTGSTAGTGACSLDQTPYVYRAFETGVAISAGRADLRRAGVSAILQIDRSADGAALVSVQPRAAHRLQRRRRARSASSRT